MRRAAITAERLRERLSYEKETGIFLWRVNVSNKRAGDIAGTLNGGYWSIGVDGSVYLAHRLAWLYVTDEWPENDVDHENHNTTDNRWENLRPATHSQNHQNRKVSVKNTSGFTGVHRANGRWAASIKIDQRRISLGRFDRVEDAAEAYASAKSRIHTFHPKVVP